MTKADTIPAKQPKRKTGIRRKVILIICLSTFIVMSIGVGIWYFFNFSALRDMVGDVHRKLSQVLATELAGRFEDEMSSLRSLAGDIVLRDAVIDSNLKKGYSSSGVTERLKVITAVDENIAGVTLFDGSGGVVASGEEAAALSPSAKKSYREFFADNKKSALVGDMEFDEELNTWVIPITVPMRDADGALIGILKVRLSARKFFSFLGDFRVDLTGHAVLIDGKGNLMFHPGITSLNVKLCGDRDYDRLLTSKGKYAIIFEPNIHKKEVFVALSEVAPRALLDSGKVWRVLIDEDTQEVFAPLYRIMPKLGLAVIFLLIMMVVIGFIFSGVLVRPIEALYAAAMQIRKGNWDYKIDIRTGDEIEQFADAFREMISNIKSKQEDLLKAKEELEKLSKSLEEKVQARTIDLTMAKEKIDNYAKELERAIMVKSDFISMASHELRTPLSAIKEGIGIVMTGKTGGINSQQKEFLDMAKRNLDRLGRIINDILDFQKLEQGKMMMKIEENDINEVIKEACNTMSHLAREKDLKLGTDLDADIPKIRFDKDKITQVLANLINNAIKFTERGSIIVSSSMEKNIVRVAVKDTGIGIKEEDLPLLFQKFTQLDKGMERRPGGSGLGLTISREIIEKHHGKIWVESKAGESSTFSFVLPIEERRNYTERKE